MSIKLENPPINELAIGVYFDREVVSLRSEHVGLFWGQVRNEFPLIQQQAALIPPQFGMFAQQPLMTLEFFPMPRFWLEASDGVTLMQIQKNAFLFNWRKRDAAYPQFATVKDAFEKNKKRFFDFLLKELNEPPPRTQLADLTYINLIEPSVYWEGLQDTPNVIPRFRLPVPETPNTDPPDFQQITSQRFAPDLTLNTTVRSARSPQDLTKPLLVIEYRASGLLQDPAAVDDWFARAHDAIGCCFTEMTNPDIQKTYWQSVIRDSP